MESFEQAVLKEKNLKKVIFFRHVILNPASNWNPCRQLKNIG